MQAVIALIRGKEKPMLLYGQQGGIHTAGKAAAVAYQLRTNQ